MDSKFDDIAPLHDHQVQSTLKELLVDTGFMHAVKYALPDVDWKDFTAEVSTYTSKYEFQSKIISPFVWAIVNKTKSTVTSGGYEHIDKKGQYLFISNHRDIILDAGILNITLHEKGYETTEIAIGDNLLVLPWIKKLVRLNKSFIVQRGVSIRQMLEVSKHLSEYIHYAITGKKESIWLAQREGRAKDSNDRTQESLLKMLCLYSDNKSIVESLKSLNITPLSISYEYDPCDYLKAQEFQMKRDNPEHKKSPKDDLVNMETGLLGYKGNVNFQFGKQINEEIEKFKEIDRKLQVKAIADCIDKEIHLNYMIYPCNYIAYDLKNGSNKFSSMYTEAQMEGFKTYLNTQIEKIKIENKDIDFLWQSMLTMYSNILKNHLIAKGELDADS